MPQPDVGVASVRGQRSHHLAQAIPDEAHRAVCTLDLARIAGIDQLVQRCLELLCIECCHLGWGWLLRLLTPVDGAQVEGLAAVGLQEERPTASVSLMGPAAAHRGRTRQEQVAGCLGGRPGGRGCTAAVRRCPRRAAPGAPPPSAGGSRPLPSWAARCPHLRATLSSRARCFTRSSSSLHSSASTSSADGPRRRSRQSRTGEDDLVCARWRPRAGRRPAPGPAAHRRCAADPAPRTAAAAASARCWPVSLALSGICLSAHGGSGCSDVDGLGQLGRQQESCTGCGRGCGGRS